MAVREAHAEGNASDEYQKVTSAFESAALGLLDMWQRYMYHGSFEVSACPGPPPPAPARP